MRCEPEAAARDVAVRARGLPRARRRDRLVQQIGRSRGGDARGRDEPGWVDESTYSKSSSRPARTRLRPPTGEVGGTGHCRSTKRLWGYLETQWKRGARSAAPSQVSVNMRSVERR